MGPDRADSPERVKAADDGSGTSTPRECPGSSGSVLESLDLSYSLPYTIARKRWSISERMQELEETAHRARTGRPDAPSLRAPLVAANAHLDYLREQVSHIHTLVRENRMGDQLRTLLADWDYRTRTFGAAHFAPSTLHVDSRVYERADLLLAPYGGEFKMPQWTQAFAVGEHAGALVDALHRGLANMRQHASMLEAPLEHRCTELVRAFESRFAELRARGEAHASALMHKASEAMHEVEELLHRAALELAAEGRRLIAYEHLPQLWRNNDFIHTGYRFIPVRNWKLLLQSIFQLHNETVNIHTHLWGLVLILPMYLWLDAHDEHTTVVDELVQLLYVVAAAKCMLCSVSWHVMAGCSDKRWFACFACIDYTGISLLVAASLQTLVYNGFYCQPDIVVAYSLGVLALGVSMAIIPWAPWFDDPRNRTLRISIFIGMAFTGIVPFFHGALLHGTRAMLSFYAPLFWSVLSYAIGVVLYFNRLPECLAPGRFDYLGHSHQLWHVAILVAVALHYRAVLHFHENRFEYSCNAAPSSADYYMPDSWLLAQLGRLGRITW